MRKLMNHAWLRAWRGAWLPYTHASWHHRTVLLCDMTPCLANNTTAPLMSFSAARLWKILTQGPSHVNKLGEYGLFSVGTSSLRERNLITEHGLRITERVPHILPPNCPSQYRFAYLNTHCRAWRPSCPRNQRTRYWISNARAFEI